MTNWGDPEAEARVILADRIEALQARGVVCRERLLREPLEALRKHGLKVVWSGMVQPWSEGDKALEGWAFPWRKR